MEELLFWAPAGYFSFYFVGRILGVKNENIKNIALIGMAFGIFRGLTGKSFIEYYLFYSKKNYK